MSGKKMGIIKAMVPGPGLPDYMPQDCRILFVGLNPGLRSAALGHHFAGHTNKFWRLMVESQFVAEGFTYTNDQDLPAYGWGITNLVSRESGGIAELRPQDYALGRELLLNKIKRLRPRILALVGVMVFRELCKYRGPVRCGLQNVRVCGISCYVLPNPSGRNAHFSYQEMLRYFVRLRKLARRREFTKPAP